MQGTSRSGRAVYGLTTSGFGVTGQASDNVGVFGSGNTAAEGSDNAARSHYDDVFADGFGANLFRGNNSGGTDVFKVSDAGLVTMYQATVGNANTYTGLYAQGYPVGVNGVDFVCERRRRNSRR